ncbi:uncharacterized protein LTR77_009539 [Saxophila tyrrhenica]|uniref:DUF7703 domain-containing protein n=1 Tax=Saxophila tyrrhenica TaxID=1690608 RepID=A0AAV9P219_9PEZI|nr:hypothetical protein LTR77_009539 [Saxophila tyrrhenica]
MGSDNPQDYGITLPIAMTISAFCAIAWVNTIELQARIWLTSKRYSGLYFWSLVLSSWGSSTLFPFLDFSIIRQANAVGVTIGVSWWCMVTGQALVLYSRLHLVVRDTTRIRWVLIMIITNFFILHLPIMILSQVGYSPVPNAGRWLDVYNIYEKVQMTGFTIQETIISGLYLYEARNVLRPGQAFQKRRVNKVLKHLIWVNIFIICLDAALLATEFANLFTIQTVFKAAIYSVKLRFEFFVLNQLIEVVGARAGVFSLSASGTHDTSRSGHNHSHQLGTMNSRHTYSAHASHGKSQAADDQKMDGVLRTTEVRVHGLSEQAEGEVEAERYHGVTHNNWTGESFARPDRRRPSSPTSSEVEFAADGAYPS